MGCVFGVEFSFLCWILGCDPFLIQGDGECLKLLKVVQPSSHQVTFNLILQAIVKGRGDDVGVSKLGFQDDLLEKLRISLHRAHLLESGQEMLSGFLFGIEVHPFESEVLLELLPNA
jgi:hypothetical protein